MKIIKIACVFWSLASIQLFGDEPNNWFTNELLAAPKDGESRPAWWFDIWGKSGLIIVASIDKEHNNLANYDWREISITKPNEKKDGVITEKIKLTAKHLKIHQIVSVSQALELEHLGIQENAIIKVFETGSFNSEFGIYKNDHKFTLGEKYIFFIKRGVGMSGELQIDYTMQIDKLDGISKIVKAAASPP